MFIWISEKLKENSKTENSRTVLGQYFSPWPSTVGLAQRPFRPIGLHRPMQRRVRAWSPRVAHVWRCGGCRWVGRREVAVAATAPVGHEGSAEQGDCGGSSPKRRGTGEGGGRRLQRRWSTAAGDSSDDDGGDEVLQHEGVMGKVRHM
jgi:hypothetical protein